MRNSQNFWDKNAGRYDRFMRKDAAAYERLYELLRPVVRHKTVLELATGTGLIAKNIVRSADHIEATDASQEMIEQAKQGVKSTKLYFSVQDMFHLPYADESFDVVIVANALHIVPEPERAPKKQATTGIVAPMPPLSLPTSFSARSISVRAIPLFSSRTPAAIKRGIARVEVDSRE